MIDNEIVEIKTDDQLEKWLDSGKRKVYIQNAGAFLEIPIETIKKNDIFSVFEDNEFISINDSIHLWAASDAYIDTNDIWCVEVRI